MTFFLTKIFPLLHIQSPSSLHESDVANFTNVLDCQTWRRHPCWPCCPWRLWNQFLCWLGMAVSPLALQGFKALNRSGCRLWGLNLRTSGVVMDRDWNHCNWFLAHGKRKRLGGCLRTVGLNAGMLNCLTAYGVWRLHRDLALIKARLPRRRQLAGCVYTCGVTSLLAMQR